MDNKQSNTAPNHSKEKTNYCISDQLKVYYSLTNIPKTGKNIIIKIEHWLKDIVREKQEDIY